MNEKRNTRTSMTEKRQNKIRQSIITKSENNSKTNYKGNIFTP